MLRCRYYLSFNVRITSFLANCKIGVDANFDIPWTMQNLKLRRHKINFCLEFIFSKETLPSTTQRYVKFSGVNYLTRFERKLKDLQSWDGLTLSKKYEIEGRYNWRGPPYHMIMHALQTVLHLYKTYSE